MSVSNNRFEKSDVNTRKRHKVVLTVNSPSSKNAEMEMSVSQVVHIEPSEQAIKAKEKRIREKQAKNAVKLAAQTAQAAEEAAQAAQAEAMEKAAQEAARLAEAEEQSLAEAIAEAEIRAEAEAEAQAAVEAVVEEQVENAVVQEEQEPEQVVAVESQDEEIATFESAPVVEQEPFVAAETQQSFDAGVVENVSATGEATMGTKKRFKLSLTQKKALSGWLFVLPFVIGILFIYGPIVLDSIAISLSEVKLSPGEMTLTWNNFGNYAYLFAEDGDPYFSITIVDGIKDLLLQIPAIVIFALFMAIILNQKMTGRAAFRAIFFLPVILSTGIIDAIDTNSAFMNAINNSQGGVDDNTGAESSGGIISAMDLQQLLGGIKIGTELVDYVVSLVNSIFDIVSRSGVQMLIFLSGLQSISPSIYESCEVEGASAWETFWKITLPMISPMILVNAIYTVIDAFTAADNRVMIYIEKIYNQGKFAYSSAMSWIYVGVVLMFIIVVALIMKTVVFYQKRD